MMARREIRRRWRGVLALTLLVAIVGTVVLATTAGDMRLAFNKPATAEAPKAASPTRTPVDERRQRETLISSWH